MVLRAVAEGRGEEGGLDLGLTLPESRHHKYTCKRIVDFDIIHVDLIRNKSIVMRILSYNMQPKHSLA